MGRTKVLLITDCSPVVRGLPMDDILTDTTNRLEQYAADRQLTPEAEAIRQEALELLMRLAALEAAAPADSPPEEFDALQPAQTDAEDPSDTESVVFGSDPHGEEWISVSLDTLISLDECL